MVVVEEEKTAEAGELVAYRRVLKVDKKVGVAMEVEVVMEKVVEGVEVKVAEVVTGMVEEVVKVVEVVLVAYLLEYQEDNLEEVEMGVVGV